MRQRLLSSPSTFFVVGVCLVVLGLALGVGAIRFEFAYAGVSTDLATADWVVDYGDLTPTDQELVANAIAGDRFVTDSLGALPGPGRGPLAVFYAGEYHSFTRRPFFDPFTDYGVASLASAIGGVGFVGVAFRRSRR